MNTISAKRYKLIPVTDLDIIYVGGIHDTITYGEQDRVEDLGDTIVVLVNDGKTGRLLERLICLKQNMLSYKFRDRLLKVEDKTPLPVIEGDAPPAE